MTPNRREFLAAGLGALLPGGAQPPIRFATSGFMWQGNRRSTGA